MGTAHPATVVYFLCFHRIVLPTMSMILHGAGGYYLLELVTSSTTTSRMCWLGCCGNFYKPCTLVVAQPLAASVVIWRITFLPGTFTLHIGKNGRVGAIGAVRARAGTRMHSSHA